MNDLFESQQKQKCYFINRDSNGKIRCIETFFEQTDKNTYTINRCSFLYQGKRLQQPPIIIDKGFSTRDPYAQCLLRFNAICKEYQDKGYKEIERDPETYSLEELNQILPEYKTDANGFAKHMLAKPLKQCKSDIIATKDYWFASRKIDGCRMSFYWDGRIRTASRGGGHYDYSMQHFIQNEQFIEFFKKHPKIILDGEAYKHGWPLQRISGACRMEKNAVDCDSLCFYMYDVMVPKLSFKVRNKILLAIEKELNLHTFNPYIEWEKDELQMLNVPQEIVVGEEEVKTLHNSYVEEGWEGLVLRDPDAFYGFGSRTYSMIKVKNYQDAEFIVRSYELGLRGTEDMVFICETPYGNIFKAKPIGDRATKEEYVANFDSKYKGKFATIKYFYYSNGGDEITGVPLQPALIAFRSQSEFV